MFWNDHAPPHFHALYAEDEAVINIQTLEIMRGWLQRRALHSYWNGHRSTGAIYWGLEAMRAQASTTQDSAAELTPAIRPQTPWRVAQVHVLANFRLHVRFLDGLEGVVDMTALVRSATAGVFAVLSDPAVFERAYLAHGAVTWPGEVDLAPDAMYDAIKASGEWHLR